MPEEKPENDNIRLAKWVGTSLAIGTAVAVTGQQIAKHLNVDKQLRDEVYAIVNAENVTDRTAEQNKDSLRAALKAVLRKDPMFFTKLATSDPDMHRLIRAHMENYQIDPEALAKEISTESVRTR